MNKETQKQNIITEIKKYLDATVKGIEKNLTAAQGSDDIKKILTEYIKSQYFFILEISIFLGSDSFNFSTILKYPQWDANLKKVIVSTGNQANDTKIFMKKLPEYIDILLFPILLKKSNMEDSSKSKKPEITPVSGKLPLTSLKMEAVDPTTTQPTDNSDEMKNLQTLRTQCLVYVDKFRYPIIKTLENYKRQITNLNTNKIKNNVVSTIGGMSDPNKLKKVQDFVKTTKRS